MSYSHEDRHSQMDACGASSTRHSARRVASLGHILNDNCRRATGNTRRGPNKITRGNHANWRRSGGPVSLCTELLDPEVLRLCSITAFLTIDRGRSQTNTMVGDIVCSCPTIMGYRERMPYLSLIKFHSDSEGLARYWSRAAIENIKAGEIPWHRTFMVLCHGISPLPGSPGNKWELLGQGM